MLAKQALVSLSRQKNKVQGTQVPSSHEVRYFSETFPKTQIKIHVCNNSVNILGVTFYVSILSFLSLGTTCCAYLLTITANKKPGNAASE